MRSFAQLFAGRTDCFGIYRVTEVQPNGKHKGKGITYPNEHHPDRVLVEDDWKRHLKGEQMLGIVPVLPDGTCNWFAIDVDDYSVSHKKLVLDIEKNELPLVTCRSKSGGAHLYCFIDGLIDAALAMDLGRRWATELGYPKAEVFPKQAKFDDDAAKGNWIIVPYFGNKSAVDFGIGLEGEKLSIKEFEQWANAKQITPDEAQTYKKKKAFDPKKMSDDDILGQSPPCVVYMFEHGIKEGGRNNALSHLCVYYKKMDDLLDTSNWKDKVVEANQSVFDDPLSYEEVAQIVKNHTSKNYQYQCNEQPMCSLCNKDACRLRRLGVGEDRSYYGDIEIMSMIKIDSKPPVWIPKVNGKDIEMDTDTLLSPRKFRMAIADELNTLIPTMTQPKHDAVIGPIMKGALTIEPMDELTTFGKVMGAFTDWTKNMITKARSLSDVEKGLPFFDKKDNRIVFKGENFLNEYHRVYRDGVTDRKIWAAMRKAGFIRHQERVGGSKPEWLWVYPMGEEEPWFEIHIGEKF